ncbi:MAG: hypothetical protein HOE90_01080 [Bacteriovoracaceae bacterium]|nr:hypothetical protein [Bacteriovoracaceae bacterium]
MKSKFFIGITFPNSNSQVNGIIQLKKRFDPGGFGSGEIYASLTPPFELENQFKAKVLEDLYDDADSFFSGLGNITVECSGVEVFKGRKNFLFLKSQIRDELYHFQKLLMGNYQFSKEVGPERKYFQSSYILLGKYKEEEDLHSAIEACSEYLEFPFQLKIEQITLFEKTLCGWTAVGNPFSFESESYATSAPFIGTF